MTIRHFCAALAIALPFAQLAQAAPPAATVITAPRAVAAPAAPPLTSGPPIAGVCVYRSNAAIELSNVGKAAGARMGQLRAQVSAEIEAERQAIQKDAEALQAKRSTLTPEQLQQQTGPLQQRAQALSQKVQLRDRELEVTGQKALQRIGASLQPIVRALYQSQHCSILVSQEAVIVGNPAMDFTQQAVNQLNAQMSTITFDREQLPQK